MTTKRDSFLNSSIPQGNKLNYNDQSLPKGGKFDLNHGWNPNDDHKEHRVGRNCDVSFNGVPFTVSRTNPSQAQIDLQQIFFDRGSTKTLNEYARNHWHLRFYFGQNIPDSYLVAAQNFVPDVWNAVLARDANEDETLYWMNRLTTAKQQSPTQLLNEAIAFERSQFYSAEYANRNRSDGDFVADLYTAYLLRQPDDDGYNFWLGVLQNDNATGQNGHDHLIRAFEESTEFADIIGSLQFDDPQQ